MRSRTAASAVIVGFPVGTRIVELDPFCLCGFGNPGIEAFDDPDHFTRKDARHTPSLLTPDTAKVRELEARKRTLTSDLANLRPVPRLAPSVIEDRLAEWRRLLRSSTTQARTVLQRILRGRLVCTLRTNPISGEVDGYDFEAPTRFDKLFTGIAVERPAGVDEAPLGSEGITAEDTFDADYGRLLERAYEKRVKVLASPTGIVSFPPSISHGSKAGSRRDVPSCLGLGLHRLRSIDSVEA